MPSVRIHLVDGSGGGAPAALAPIKHTRLEHSAGRATVLVGLFLSMSLGAGVAFLGDSPLYACSCFSRCPS